MEIAPSPDQGVTGSWFSWDLGSDSVNATNSLCLEIAPNEVRQIDIEAHNVQKAEADQSRIDACSKLYHDGRK